MAITFAPSQGMILICDYTTGFRAPEMVKARPVVVISARRRVGAVCTVVPLSSTEPSPAMPWHHRLSAAAYPPAREPMWAKCDMLAAVACHRLDRVKVRDRSGQRTYRAFEMPADDMAAILAGVKAALGLT